MEQDEETGGLLAPSSFGVSGRAAGGPLSPLQARIQTVKRFFQNPLNAAAAALGLVCFIALVSTAARPAAAPAGACAPAPPPPPSPQQAFGPTGAVAADDPRCSAIGRDALRDGGNAVDAAVAVSLCLGVVHPMSSGIGGGCFIVIFNATTGVTEVVDARETAPAGASQDMFVGKPHASLTGGAAVAVPGEVAGLYAAWQRHGRLPWAKLVEPAAKLADGFDVGPHLADDIEHNKADLTISAAMAAVFLPGGKPLRQGQKCVMRDLARTLRAIGAGGAAAFYGIGGGSAAIAEGMAAAAQASGGTLTLADLRGYTPIWRQPLRMEALGLTFLAAPPPSSGGATIMQTVNFIAGYGLPMAGAAELGFHRLVEGFKHAFAMRMSLGDPIDPFVRNNTEAIKAMTSAAFAATLRGISNDSHTQPVGAYGGRFSQLDDHGTSHLSIIDSERNAVALTTTVNTKFGAKLMTADGIILNNEMDDFSSPGQPNGYGLAPSRANFVAPGKRPLSSMSPTIVLQGGRVRMVAGASGGPRIITATIQALLNVLVYGTSPLDAVLAPRIHHQLLPDVARLERYTTLDGEAIRVPEAVEAALRRRGHNVSDDTSGAVVQVVTQDMETGLLHAVSDPRKGGLPAAY